MEHEILAVGDPVRVTTLPTAWNPKLVVDLRFGFYY